MDNKTSRYEDIFHENLDLLDLSDGILHTEDGHTFQIHKIVLATCSTYFSALFCGLGKGKKDYVIPGVSGKVLSDILTYIYSGKIQVTARNICDIMVASDYFLLDDLLSRMYMLVEDKRTLKNCLAIHIFLFQVYKSKLLIKSYRFIQTHFEEILNGRCESFCNLPLECLKNFLLDRNLRVQREGIVWQAIVKWVDADVPNRLQNVPELLMYLRITEENESLVDEILTHDIVTTNAFCETVMFRSKTDFRENLQSHQCNVWNDTHFGPFHIQRKPMRLNFMCKMKPSAKIYVTYDENVDLWRKIVKIDWPPDYLLCIHDCIYLFNSVFPETNLRYNFIEKRFVELEHFRVQRFYQVFVALDRYIYILGGTHSNQAIYDVEIYDPEENTWRDTTPMLPIVRRISAVTLNGVIYVVGLNNEGNGMSAQMYDPSTETWNELPKPLLLSFTDISLVCYNEKIYKFGIAEGYAYVNVEVFEPLHSVWYAIQSLPYTYRYIRALVINDELIICEGPREETLLRMDINPPVQWSKENENWKDVAYNSPLFKTPFYFISVQEGDNINEINKENKIPATAFRGSPFS